MYYRPNEQLPTFRFEVVEIFRGEGNSLGIGSYGAVYKARCDELHCAAKILHPILFQSNDPASSRILERFRQECIFMSGITHPNIVQYLGSTIDPQNGLPVLLMELLDESLTKFLERSPSSLPYHVQVSLAHDVVLALAYLHSNHIIHRDLSGNNVLVIAGCKAKVTDFGMSRLLGDDEATRNRLTFTKLPGTEVYMPPECLLDRPVYNEKIDIFSFGVLLIQIMTRLFPSPTERVLNRGSGLLQLVPERQRRKQHIDLVTPTHPLLQIAFGCLDSDKDNRPTARDICTRIATLKTQPRYAESTLASRDGGSSSPTIHQLERRVEALQQQVVSKDDQISAKECQLQEVRRQLDAKETTIIELHQQIRAAESIRRSLAERDSALQRRDSQIEVLQREVQELRIRSDSTTSEIVQEPPAMLTMNWQQLGRAPTKMVQGASTVHGDIAYIRPAGKTQIYAYNRNSHEWSELATCRYNASALAHIEGRLTTIGGREGRYGDKNELLGYTSRGSQEWLEYLPPMTQKRTSPSTVCNQSVLVVAGGIQENNTINSVEVLDLRTKIWHNAQDLPHSLSQASATICNDNVYLVGGWDQRGNENKSVLTCDINALVRSSSQNLQCSKWKLAAQLPEASSTCATASKKLVAIGGKASGPGNAISSNVHTYDPISNKWEPTSQLTTARSSCFALNFDTELVVIGGYVNRRRDTTDLIESTNI